MLELHVAKTRHCRTPVHQHRTPARPEQPVTPHEHNVQHRQREKRINRLFLRHIAEYHVDSAVRGIDPPLSTLRPDQSQQAAQQGGLARAVGSDKADEISRRKGELHPLQDTCAAVPKFASRMSVKRSLIARLRTPFSGEDPRINLPKSATSDGIGSDRLFPSFRWKPESSSFPNAKDLRRNEYLRASAHSPHLSDFLRPSRSAQSRVKTASCITIYPCL